MKAITTICLLFALHIATAQNAFLFGELIGSDSTRIEIWHDGEKILDKSITDVHYALQLGARTHYTIKFTSEGRVKYMHLMNVGYYPEKIETDVDFRKYEHAIIYKSQETKRGTNLLLYRSKRIIDKAKF